MATSHDPYLQWFRALVYEKESGHLLALLAESPRSLAALAAASNLTTESVENHLAALKSLKVVVADTTGDGITYRLNEDRLRRALDDLATVPNDIRGVVGEPAPQFRLPASDGRDVELAGCLAKGPTIVWISRGIICPFCRRYRAQLTIGYPAFRSYDTQILEIAPTPIDRATSYFAGYQLAFPYLCEPDGIVAGMYGVKRGFVDPLHELRVVLADVLSNKEVTHELLSKRQVALTPDDLNTYSSYDGFFIIDRSGVIQVANVGIRIGIPANHEIERRLREVVGV